MEAISISSVQRIDKAYMLVEDSSKVGWLSGVEGPEKSG